MPFRDIVGHRRLVALLSRSVARKSLPPSLIFAGPEGTGKRLAALATAQALNCTAVVMSASADAEVPLDACGSCAACTRIARGVHPDVLLLTPGASGSIKIEAVRHLIERAAFKPFEGRRRVAVIDDADALVTPAQSALLKTLEEPPPSSVFILVTGRPDVLLPTVRSRCPLLRFGSLGADDIATELVRRGYSEAEGRSVAATADGSLRKALDVGASTLVAARQIAQDVLVHVAATRDPPRRIEGAKTLLSKTSAGGAGDREQLARHLRAMASLLRDVELLALGGDVRSLANPDVKPALEALAGTFQGERGVRAFRAVDEALMALDRNAGVKIVADWILMHL